MDKFKRHFWLSPKSRTYIVSLIVFFALLYGMLPFTVLRPSLVERVLNILNKLPFVCLDLASTQQWTYSWLGKAFDIVLVIFIVIFMFFAFNAIKDIAKGKPHEKSIGEINREIRNKMRKYKK
jgi:preprotein translocase subunit YajC